jgi:CheY-like chemotaxis protein
VSESLAGLAVLIVDDEPDAREVMAHALTVCGARVLTAADAREALALLGSEHADVLLADIAMPGMDGYALLRHIRALTDPRVATLPAIAVTAHARETERQEACAVGFQDHVAKPTDPVHLARVIGRLVHGAPCA